MSKSNANIADYLKQIESLTNTNLQILKTLNDSFYTKKNHLYAEIDDSTYVIPSFISLENKINMLQENFENLVKSPETCEAYFNFDGNTRAIEVRKYNYTPDSIKLPIISNYNIESNSIFKDFLTPVPFINIELPQLPNDVSEVNVKKIVVKSDSLKNIFKNRLSYLIETTNDKGETVSETRYHQSINDTYSNIYKLLYNYAKEVDYEEYDSVYKLPTRKNIGTSTYVIEKVVSDIIDDDLNELITLKLRSNLTDSYYNNKLTYKLFDETIEKQLQVGDELINYDGTGKVVITNIISSTNTITVKVVNGEYLNFLGTDSYDTNNDTNIHNLSKLRFYDSIDFDSDKYVKVPLEEDQYVFIAVAPINNRLNIQSSWGIGILLDVHSLININNDVDFKTYYDTNVKNIGDILFEMTSMITSPITPISKNDFNLLTSLKPTINANDLTVMQINKHLNNSSSVKNIRKAYQQKKSAQIELEQLQVKIDDINQKISSTAFNDSDGLRSVLISELSTLTTQKKDLLNIINNSINEISLNLNSSEVPIDNAKYRIRGFYVPNLSNVQDIVTNDHVIGIYVQYRYKNISSDTGNAVTMVNGDKSEAFIYSDWNLMTSFNKNKIVEFKNNKYTYVYDKNDEIKNEPSYNQIDIPISQGETVDIRLKVLYDFGQPYISLKSDWSNIISISFPDEFVQNNSIKTIANENYSDSESMKINNILESSGINVHVSDKLIDQNITYYHNSESIASGFYTNERKIIPLKDKLVSISNDIASIKDMIDVYDTTYEISTYIDNTPNKLYSDRENIIMLTPYDEFTNGNNQNGYYKFEDGIVSVNVNISIRNTGNNILKLYSLFPGRRDVILNNSNALIVNKNGYCNDSNEGVIYKYKGTTENNTVGLNSSLQTQNQFILFRLNDIWDGTPYYSKDASPDSQYLNSTNADDLQSGDVGMVVYPLLNTQYGLCINSDEVRTYKTVNPNEEIIIPLHCMFATSEDLTQICKTISFDIRTNLYSDITNYMIKIVVNNSSTIQNNALVQTSNSQYTTIL